jgi:hypothetical protein
MNKIMQLCFWAFLAIVPLSGVKGEEVATENPTDSAEKPDENVTFIKDLGVLWDITEIVGTKEFDDIVKFVLQYGDKRDSARHDRENIGENMHYEIKKFLGGSVHLIIEPSDYYNIRITKASYALSLPFAYTINQNNGKVFIRYMSARKEAVPFKYLKEDFLSNHLPRIHAEIEKMKEQKQ